MGFLVCAVTLLAGDTGVAADEEPAATAEVAGDKADEPAANEPEEEEAQPRAAQPTAGMAGDDVGAEAAAATAVAEGDIVMSEDGTVEPAAVIADEAAPDTDGDPYDGL